MKKRPTIDQQKKYYDDRAIETKQLVEKNKQRASEPLWRNIEGDDEWCRSLTGFTCAQVLSLYNLCEPRFPEPKTGRGRRSRFKQIDKLIILLCYVSHYEVQTTLEKKFGVARSRLAAILLEISTSVCPVLYEHFVDDVQQLSKRKKLTNFPEAKFMIDITSQNTNLPDGLSAKADDYYSERDHHYRFKTLTIHNRRGLMLAVSAGHPGSSDDLTIAESCLRGIERTVGHDGQILVRTPLIGLNCDIVHPHVSEQPLTKEQQQFNKQLSKEMELCSHWYEQLQSRYRIMSDIFRSDHSNYVFYFRLCAALTNFYLLTSED